MDSNLYNTVAKDDVVVLREIEGGGLTVADQLTPTKSTVLHLACQYGSFSCVEHILETHQSLLLKINSRGETALHLAAKQGNIGVVGALLSSARFLDQQQNNPQNSTVVQALIRTPDKELETALHGAVRYNRNDVVGLLVGEDPRHVHPQNKHNESPLYLASIRCYADIIRTIFNKCEWPDIGSAEGRRVLHAMFGGPEGRTALHAALLDEGGLACVKVLLNKNKALTKVVDNYGWTAYHYVAYNNLDTIVEALVGDGADKSVAYLQDNEYKRTALHVAACKGNLRVLKKLIEYFPDSWEIEDGSGRNIFHIAVEQNRKEVIDFIMSRGFETSNNLMTKRDNNGNTPLHMIAKLGCYVPQLMGQTWDVDWEVLDSKNLTPLDVLHSEQEKHTLADQLMVRQSLIKAKVKKHWRLWRTLKEPDAEFGRRIVKHSEKTNNEQVEECWKAINSHMVVSALIATVAFTALFNIPGGFDGDKGPTQGSPLLLRDDVFGYCILFDAMALLLSVISLLLYFVTTLNNDARHLRRIVQTTAAFNFCAIVTMMMAFITGTYAVLKDKLNLAIIVCTVTSFFLLCAIPVYITLFRGKKRSTTLLPTSGVSFLTM